MPASKFVVAVALLALCASAYAAVKGGEAFVPIDCSSRTGECLNMGVESQKVAYGS